MVAKSKAVKYQRNPGVLNNISLIGISINSELFIYIGQYTNNHIMSIIPILTAYRFKAGITPLDSMDTDKRYPDAAKKNGTPNRAKYCLNISITTVFENGICKKGISKANNSLP